MTTVNTTDTIVSSFNNGEINNAVASFATRAKSVKQSSMDMHKALVIIVANAFETGKHDVLRDTVNGEHVTRAYKTAIARFLNTYLPHSKARVKEDGEFMFSFAKAHKEDMRLVKNDVEFMANLFNHPFYEVATGNGASDEDLKVFNDDAVVALLKNVFKRVNRLASADSEKLAKRGYASVDIDFDKLNNAKTALRELGIDVFDT